MLIEFEVGNCRSFRDPVVLSLAAAAINEHEENVIESGRYRLLPSAALYGANASGKSNLLGAFVFMRNFVLASSKDTQTKDLINVQPFLLDTQTPEKPSRFEMRFLLDDMTYRYGFEVDRYRIHSEWLFQATKIKETELFTRENQEIKVSVKFPEGESLQAKTRDNALYLSVVAQFNGPVATRILAWFDAMIPLHGLADGQYGRSMEWLSDPVRADKLFSLLKKADLDIEGLRVIEHKADPKPLQLVFTQKGKGELVVPLSRTSGPFQRLESVHALYEDGKRIGQVAMDFETAESHGTRKFFQIAGPVLDALEQGRVMIVDEFDSRLHPLLSLALVHLFHSPKTNPHHAQLIFATHDTLLLRHGKLRRDQIWFVEKDRQECSKLYSLAEIKVRKEEAFDKNYLDGRYGAVPNPELGDFLQDVQ